MRKRKEECKHTNPPTSQLRAIVSYSILSLTIASKMANNRSRGKGFAPERSEVSFAYVIRTSVISALLVFVCETERKRSRAHLARTRPLLPLDRLALLSLPRYAFINLDKTSHIALGGIEASIISRDEEEPSQAR